MTQSHTPGPWEVNENNPINVKITQKQTGTIAILPSVFITERGYEEMKANARLIAAAPDLLAALKAVIESPQVRADLTRERLKMATEAIQKAGV